MEQILPLLSPLGPWAVVIALLVAACALLFKALRAEQRAHVADLKEATEDVLKVVAQTNENTRLLKEAYEHNRRPRG